MNIVPLRKSLIKESVIFAIILAVVGGGLWYICMLQAEYEQKKNAEASATSQLLAEKQGLEEKFNKVLKNIEVFQESQHRASDVGLFLHGDALRDVLAYYRLHLLLSQLKVDASPVTEIKNDPKYTRPHFIGTSSAVTISLQALSDADIYTLIRALQEDLPGFIKIKSIDITKTTDLTKDILKSIKRNGPYAIIDGKIILDWYGIKATATDSPFNKYITKKREATLP